MGFRRTCILEAKLQLRRKQTKNFLAPSRFWGADGGRLGVDRKLTGIRSPERIIALSSSLQARLPSTCLDLFCHSLLTILCGLILSFLIRQ